MIVAARNYILPAGSEFNAVVDGKRTGLAGCTRSAECERTTTCLRADAGLPTRFDLANGQPTAKCLTFIPRATTGA